ncbi:MAG: cysteine desulfuration protein SufE [Alphaproteobacteria bacterium]|jgi:cysteine desulfuration protein SufE
MVLAINDTKLDYNELLENLSFLDDWEERYGYILELGKKIPPFPDTYKTDIFQVKGCVSQVWLYPEMRDDKLFFKGGSDSQLVQGLVAIILIIYSGLSKIEIQNIDFQAKFTALGLSEQLTPQRSNGVFSMIQKIQDYAKH